MAPLPIAAPCLAERPCFFPILNTVVGEGVGDCTVPSDCDITLSRRAVAAAEDNPTTLEVGIYGRPAKNPGQFRVASPVFNVFALNDAIISQGTHGLLISDGYCRMLI